LGGKEKEAICSWLMVMLMILYFKKVRGSGAKKKKTEGDKSTE
jgi:hypothetical protein